MYDEIRRIKVVAACTYYIYFYKTLANRWYCYENIFHKVEIKH